MLKSVSLLCLGGVFFNLSFGDKGNTAVPPKKISAIRKFSNLDKEEKNSTHLKSLKDDRILLYTFGIFSFNLYEDIYTRTNSSHTKPSKAHNVVVALPPNSSSKHSLYTIKNINTIASNGILPPNIAITMNDVIEHTHIVEEEQTIKIDLVEGVELSEFYTSKMIMPIAHITMNSQTHTGNYTLNTVDQEFTMTNSTITGTFSASRHDTTINLSASSIAGTLDSTGRTSLTLNNSTVGGKITFSNANDTINITGSQINELETNNGTDIINITNSTATGNVRVSGTISVKTSTIRDLRVNSAPSNLTVENSTITAQLHTHPDFSNSLTLRNSSVSQLAVSGNDTIRVHNSTLGSYRTGSIDPSYTMDIALYDTSVTGNVTYSQYTPQVGNTKSFLENVHIGGTIVSKGVLELTFNNSTVIGDVTFEHLTSNDTLVLTGSTFSNITISGGNNSITSTSSTLQDITIQGSGNNSLILTNSTATTLILGTGTNTLTATNFTLTNGITFGATNVGGANITLTNSTIGGALTANDSSTISLTKTSVNGDVSISKGILRSTITDSTIIGLIGSSTSNDSLTITNSSANAIHLGAGGDTVIGDKITLVGGITNRGSVFQRIELSNSSLGGSIATGPAGDSIVLTNTSIFNMNSGSGIDTIAGTNATLTGGGITSTGSATINLTTSSVNGGIAITDRLNITGTNATVSGNITAGSHDNTAVFSSSSIRELVFGSGNHVMTFTNSTATLLNSVGPNTTTLNNSSISGTVRFGGMATFSSTNSTIAGNLNFSNATDSIAITNSTFLNLSTANGNDSIALTSSTLTGGGITSTANATINLSASSINGAIAITTKGDITTSNATINGNVSAGVSNNSGIFTSSSMNNITFGNGNNTLSLTNSTANILSIGGANTTTLNNSSVGGITAFTGASIFNATNSTVGGNLTFSNGNDSITINNSTLISIDTASGADTLKISNSTTNSITMNGSNLDFTLNSVKATGDVLIKGINTIAIENRSTIDGKLRIEERTNLTINSSTITDSIWLSNSANTISINNATLTHINDTGGSNSISITNSQLDIMETSSNVTRASTVSITNSVLDEVRVYGRGNHTVSLISTTVDKINLGFGTTNSLETTGTSVTGNIVFGFGTSPTIGGGTAILTTTKIDGNITAISTLDITTNNSSIVGNIALSGVNNTVSLTSTSASAITTGGGTNTFSATSLTVSNITIGGASTFTMAGNNAVTGNIALQGNTTASISGLTLDGALNITTGTVHSVSISSSSIPSLSIPSGTLTLNFTNTTLGTLQTNSSTTQTTLSGNNTLTSNAYIFGTGANSHATVNGSVFINPPTGTDVTFTTNGELTISDNASLILSSNMYGQFLKLSVSNIQHSGNNPAIVLNTNVRTGGTTKLDISAVNNLVGSPNLLINILPSVSGTGSTPLSVIEEVIVSNANIKPITNGMGYVLAGHDYSLVENAAKPNVYDLVRNRLSETNHGYAAAQTNIHVYNNLVATNLVSALSQEAGLSRNREGQKILQKKNNYFAFFTKPKQGRLDELKGRGTPGFTIWTNAGYSSTEQKVENAPNLKSNMLSGMVGATMGSLPLGDTDDFSLLLQVFTGASNINNSFETDPITGVSTSVTQMGLTLGGSAGLEWLYNDNTSKLATTFSLWYVMMNNSLKSNVLQENTTWNTHAINAMGTISYSYYTNKFILTPQAELHYSFIPSQIYVSPDSNMVEFNGNHSIIAKANIVIGYTVLDGLLPYVRGGVEIPLLSTNMAESINYSGSSFSSSYTSSNFVATAGGGISYSRLIRIVTLSISAEALGIFGNTSGFEANLSVGVSF